MKSFVVHILLVSFSATVPVVGLWKIYTHYKKILEKQYGTWRHIGTLKKILIYPLEGPQGISIKSGFCFKDGLVNYPDKYNKKGILRDRSHVLYSQTTGNAITLDPGLMKLGNIEAWTSLLKHGKKDYCLANQPIPINYLGNNLLVKPLVNVIAHRSITENCKSEFLKVGCINAVRSSFEPKSFEDMDFDGYESNFSTYTLVNLQSLEPIKEMFRRGDLTYKNFLPNFIIDCPVYEGFIEDHIKQLKIGSNAYFEKVTPCTHTKFIDANPDQGLNFSGLFEALQSIRALNKLFPKLSNSTAPVFGINLEIINHTGNVSAEDPVYATFRFNSLSYIGQILEIASYITQDIRRKCGTAVTKNVI